MKTVTERDLEFRNRLRYAFYELADQWRREGVSEYEITGLVIEQAATKILEAWNEADRKTH
jgi:hypothetical protein